MTEEAKHVISRLSQQFDQETPQYQPEVLARLQEAEPEIFQWIMTQIGQESSHEAGWIRRETRYLHKRLRQEEMTFAQGMDAFGDLQREGPILLEGRYSAFSDRLRHIVQFLYDHLPERYVELCNRERDPLWLFPLLRDLGNPDKSGHAYSILTRLIEPLQGLCAGYVWMLVFKESREREELTDTTTAQLTRLLHALTTEQQWIYAATALEELVRSAFPTRIDIQYGDKQIRRSVLFTFVGWMSAQFGSRAWTREEIVSIFLPHLTGRVNRESWLGALYLANVLSESGDPAAQQNALLLREEVARQYPYLWVKEHKRNSYFSGEQSLALLEELAKVFRLLHGIDSIGALRSVQGVATAAQLWKLRDVHKYGEYLDERRLSFAHGLLLIMLVQLHVDQQQQMPDEWPDVEREIFQLCTQLVDDHLIDSEDMILRDLLAGYALLWVKAGHVTNYVPRLIRLLPSPVCSVYLFKHLGKTGLASDLRAELRKVIEKYFGGLRSQERMKLVQALYEVQEWELCLGVLERIPLNHNRTYEMQQFHYRLYASTVLHVLTEEYREEDVRLLRNALAVMDEYHRLHPHMYEENYDLFRGYLVGALYDRGQLDWAVLRNEYHGMRTRPGEATHLGRALAFVRAELLMRLLDGMPSADHSYAAAFEESMLMIEQLDEIDGLRWLMKAWYAERNQRQDESQEYLRQVKQYREQILQAKPLLPLPLRRYLGFLTGESDAGV